MGRKNLENEVAAAEAKKTRKAEFAEMSAKQKKINQYSPKARQVLGHILRLPAKVQEEIKQGVGDIF